MKTDVGLDFLSDGLKGDISDTQMKYFAWGDGTPAMDGSDVALDNELGRIQITSITDTGTGELDIISYVGKTVAVGQIEEIGIFAGAAAGAGADSGVLTDIWLYSRLKTNLEAIQFKSDDLIVRA